MNRTVESVRLQLQRGIFSEDDARWLLDEVERLSAWKAESQRALSSASIDLLMTGTVTSGAVSLGDAVKAVCAEVARLRADLAFEKQLHKEAIAEVERLQTEQARHWPPRAEVERLREEQSPLHMVRHECRRLHTEVERLRAEATNLVSLRPIETLHEDHGVVLLWTFREDGGCDAPGIGSSIDDWFNENDYTHWSPLPNPKHGLPKPPEVTS